MSALKKIKHEREQEANQRALPVLVKSWGFILSVMGSHRRASSRRMYDAIYIPIDHSDCAVGSRRGGEDASESSGPVRRWFCCPGER